MSTAVGNASDFRDISTALRDASNCRDLATDAANLWLELAALGVFCRGSCVVGDAYHADEVAFGPAIVEAYALEKCFAVYPRIIVRDDVREVLPTGTAISQDHADGLFYLDPLGNAFKGYRPRGA